MEKIDRRIERTRNALGNAYIELLKTNKAEHITVSMLAAKANINRATFYMHFSNIEVFLEELLYEFLAGLRTAILQAFKQNNNIDVNMLTPTTEAIFKYIEENQEAFQALYKEQKDFKKHLEKLFQRIFIEEIFIETKSDFEAVNYEIFIHYQTKATLGLIYYWIESNYYYSKQYMMKQLTILSNTEIVCLKLKKDLDDLLD